MQSSSSRARGNARTETIKTILPNATNVRLPLQFIVTGILALGVGIGFLLMQPELLATYHYNQHIIAVTHIFVLGWLLSIVMGATYQLVPVALETKLHSEKIAGAQFYFHIIGVAGMVWSFWIWDIKHLGCFGAIFALGIGLFVFNLVRTLKRIPRWNIIAASIAASLFWICFTVVAGLYAAASKYWNFSPFGGIAQMHAHAHLGAIGFFFQILLGVSYKLVPMFTLSEVQSPRRAWWSVILLNLGLLGAFVGILTQSSWKIIFTLVTIGGLVIYGIEMKSIFAARKRKNHDWGMKYFFTALALFVPLSILGIVLSWPNLPANEFTGQLENVYGIVAFLGVLTIAILGMLYKIVPFLIWYGSYSREIGRSKVPALAELYSERLQAIGYFIYVSGFVVTAVAAGMGSAPGVRSGCAILAASLLVFAVNVAKILGHLFRPRLEPLPLRAKSAA